MKRFFLLIAVALLLTVCAALPPTEASAAEIASGNCGKTGDNVTWILDDTGTLTISGTGEMKDYSPFIPAPWSDYKTEIKHVVINEGVTVIGSCSFPVYENLTDVTIADSVTEIGNGACYSNTNLTNVTLPSNLTTIEQDAFSLCTGLTSVTIPGSVTKFNSAFNECTGLESVTVLEGVTKIGDLAFCRCTNLTSIILPDSVTTIGPGAFEYCTALTSVTFPGDRIALQPYAFAYCSNLKIVRFLGEEVHIDGFALWDVPIWHVLYGGNEKDWESDLEFLEQKLDIIITYHYNCAEGNDPVTCTVTNQATCNAEGQTTYHCATRNDNAVHQFSDTTAETSTQICTVCGYHLSAEPEQQEADPPIGVIVTVAIVVLACGGAVTSIVLLKKKRR